MRGIAAQLREEEQAGVFSYIQQREIILRLFKNVSSYDISTIILRLTIIDSFYSTNAEYSYFSIEEMATNIYSLGENEADAVDYFKKIASGGSDDKNLFGKKYGMRKDCTQGSKQVALMSKYAYYVLLRDGSSNLGFPIYDSLVIKTYPLVCKKLSVAGGNINTDDITEYVDSLDALRKELFGNNDNRFEGMQQFDILDAYLWRMGKLCGGNYSLLLTRDDYNRFISNLSLNARDDQSLWNRFNAKLPKDVVKTTYKSKTGKETEKYKINFNAIIEYQCRSLETKSIVSGLKSGIIFSLIEHWKEYYVE